MVSHLSKSKFINPTKAHLLLLRYVCVQYERNFPWVIGFRDLLRKRNADRWWDVRTSEATPIPPCPHFVGRGIKRLILPGKFNIASTACIFTMWCRPWLGQTMPCDISPDICRPCSTDSVMTKDLLLSMRHYILTFILTFITAAIIFCYTSRPITH